MKIYLTCPLCGGNEWVEAIHNGVRIGFKCMKCKASADVYDMTASCDIPDAILVEQDYKGQYARYVVTPEEFEEEFMCEYHLGMKRPSENGESWTLEPLVHVWYQKTTVNSDLWYKFLTDMSFQLPESDIENKNHAYLHGAKIKALRSYLPEESEQYLI